MSRTMARTMYKMKTTTMRTNSVMFVRKKKRSRGGDEERTRRMRKSMWMMVKSELMSMSMGRRIGGQRG